jgi:hemolysin III
MSSPTALDPPSEPPPTAEGRPLLRGWIHLVAFCVTLVVGPILIAQARTAEQTFVLVVYILSVLALFGVSAAFHRVRWSPTARRRMRRADHSTIFIGIAGSYTAIAGLALHGWARVLVLILVWGGAAAGITLRQVWLDAPKWAVALPYVVMGWCAIAVVPQLGRGLGWAGFWLLLAGGACYTVGAVIYALRRPNPSPAVFGYHEVFHALTVVGASLHFAVIAFYALPRAR